MKKSAETLVPINPLLAERWSTRAFDAHHEISKDQLLAMLEAARWAPSWANGQPWRFIVGRRGEVHFKTIFSRLSGGNQAWAHRAGALIVALTEATDADGAPRSHAEYDAGLAVANLSVQAHSEGLVVHQLGGFDAEGIASDFSVDERLRPVVVLAIGAHDPDHELPEPFATRENAARVRRPLNELLLDVDGEVLDPAS